MTSGQVNLQYNNANREISCFHTGYSQPSLTKQFTLLTVEFCKNFLLKQFCWKTGFSNPLKSLILVPKVVSSFTYFLRQLIEYCKMIGKKKKKNSALKFVHYQNNLIYSIK